MEHLTENSIKKATLRFLKAYYKFRPRTSETTTSFDQQTSDGIQADGYLSFVQEDGAKFVCTFEATSFDTREEVLYKKQTRILYWDAMAFSALAAALIFSINHALDFWTINHIGWIWSCALLFLVLAFTFWIYQLFFGGIPRYRYIYAVEQFKRYHADEQWIAISDDVFASAVDPDLAELKDQCVRNGFGLITVDQFQEAHMLITPSRQEVFGKKRANRQFYSRDAAEKRSKRKRFAAWWNNLLSRVSSNRLDNPTLRYQRSFWNQMLLCSVGLLIISGIFFRESQEAPIVKVDEDQYEKDLAQLAKTSKPEDDFYVLDTPYVDPPGGETEPYLTTNQNYTLEDETSFGDIFIATGEGDYVIYDCERFFNYIGTKFVIQEGMYPSMEGARKRTHDLFRQGVNANSLWLGCLDGTSDNYIVFIDFLFDSETEAKGLAKSYSRRFRKTDLKLEVRSVTL